MNNLWIYINEMVDRQHYIVDNPKVAVIEIESILDIISYADEDALNRMMRHALAYMKPHNFDHVVRDSKETTANKEFDNDDAFEQHRNEIMKAIFRYVEYINDSHEWARKASLLE